MNTYTVLFKVTDRIIVVLKDFANYIMQIGFLLNYQESLLLLLLLKQLLCKTVCFSMQITLDYKVLLMVENNVTVGLLKALVIITRNQHVLWNVWKISHCLTAKRFITARPVIIPHHHPINFRWTFLTVSHSLGGRSELTWLRLALTLL